VTEPQAALRPDRFQRHDARRQRELAPLDLDGEHVDEQLALVVGEIIGSAIRPPIDD